MKPFKTVDEYIESAPQEVQKKLHELRTAIRDAAPEAEERISYGMPYYGYKGRFAYFSYTKNHIGLYLMPPLIENHKDELKGYETSTATIRFPLEGNLPIPLIKKLLKVAVKTNEEKKNRV